MPLLILQLFFYVASICLQVYAVFEGLGLEIKNPIAFYGAGTAAIACTVLYVLIQRRSKQ